MEAGRRGICNVLYSSTYTHTHTQPCSTARFEGNKRACRGATSTCGRMDGVIWSLEYDVDLDLRMDEGPCASRGSQGKRYRLVSAYLRHGRVIGYATAAGLVVIIKQVLAYCVI